MASRVITWALRLLVLLILLLLVFSQALLLPALAGEVAQSAPEFAVLKWPLLVASWVVLACGEAILIAIWGLLSAVDASRIFDARAFRWTTTITVSAGLATLVCLAVTISLLVIPGIGPITVHMMTVATTIGGASLTLLMSVMTALLKKATALQTEMDEVI